MALEVYEFLLKKGLERRRAQEKFFNIVLSAIEEGNNCVKIIQAPTGTGKTYGYLIPLMEMGQKAIISTGTKLLQEQLRRDIETLRSYYSYIHGRDISYLILKGKSNYLCLDRFYDLPVDKRPAELEMAIEGSWDGDFEFVSLEPELREKLCVEDDYCTPHYRQTCRFRQECYYWGKIKGLERQADLLVINHALLSLKDFENPEERVLVLDEAHELDKYITSSLTFGVSLYTLRVDIMSKVLDFLKDARLEAEEFFIRHFEGLFKDQREERPLESLKPYAEDFEKHILSPLLLFHRTIRENLISELTEFITNKLFVSLDFKEYLLKSSLLDWEKYLDLRAEHAGPTDEEQRWIKRLRNYELLRRRIQRLRDFHKVMKEDPPGMGYLVGRRFSKKLQTFNYRLEVFPIFPAGHVDFTGYKAVIITSATLDPEDIGQTLGIEGEYYELEHTFPYERVNFLVYKTDPKERTNWEDCLRFAYKYLRSLYDKVLVLLTNKEHMRLFEKEEGIAFQGEGSLSNLLENLRSGKINTLVGLDSLWFGIDIKGEKGLLMTKLPFESPDEPITFHRIRFLKSIGLDPFEYQKRKALIKFRQGIGRLMRSKEDRGTIVLCDKRIYRFREFLKAVQDLGIRVKNIST